MAAESSRPCSASGIPDLPPERRPEDSRSTADQCSGFQSDARPRIGSNTCSPFRSHRWEMSSPADRWWSFRRNTVAAGLHRRCSPSGWFRRWLLHRIREHHTHTCCHSSRSARSRSSRWRSITTYTSRNTELVSSWLMSSRPRSTCVAVLWLWPDRPSERASAERTSCCAYSDQWAVADCPAAGTSG